MGVSKSYRAQTKPGSQILFQVFPRYALPAASAPSRRGTPQPPPGTSAPAPRGQFRRGERQSQGRRANERNGQVLLNSGPPRGPHPSSRGLRLERKWEGFNLFLTPAPSCPNPSPPLGAPASLILAPRPGRGARAAAGCAEKDQGRRATSTLPPGPAATLQHNFIYVFLTVLGLCGCTGFSLARTPGGCSLVAVRGFSLWCLPLLRSRNLGCTGFRSCNTCLCKKHLFTKCPSANRKAEGPRRH